jgi:hypothetical protein
MVFAGDAAHPLAAGQVGRSRMVVGRCSEVGIEIGVLMARGSRSVGLVAAVRLELRKVCRRTVVVAAEVEERRTRKLACRTWAAVGVTLKIQGESRSLGEP